jgi:hypothetical protein
VGLEVAKMNDYYLRRLRQNIATLLLAYSDCLQTYCSVLQSEKDDQIIPTPVAILILEYLIEAGKQLRLLHMVVETISIPSSKSPLSQKKNKHERQQSDDPEV